MGGEAELDVAAALYPQGADDLQAGRTQEMVLLVGQRLRGGNDDAVPGVDAHGVQVLHVADDDAGVRSVPHDLVLELFPALQVALQQHLSDGTCAKAAADHRGQLLQRPHDAAARAAQGVGGAHDQRKAQLLSHPLRLLQGGDAGVWRLRLADVVQELAKELPVLGLANGREGCAQQTDVVLLQDAAVRELHGQVQPRLASQGGQHAVGPLPGDDAFEDVRRQGFDVDDVGDAFVGHDGGGVGVDEDGDDPLLAQGLARLGAGVVELCGLTDDDGPGADDQHLGGKVRHACAPAVYSSKVILL